MRKRAVVRVGIIGAGPAARNHAVATASRSRVELVAVAASSMQSAGALARDIGGAAVTVPQLLARRDVDLVIICSPNDLHCQHIREVANAGKHVLVEKPIGLDWQDAEAAVAYCRAAGVLVGVVHPRRFDHTWVSILRMTRSGILGRLLWVDASVRFFRPPRYYASVWRGRLAREGGPHLTQGIHYIDIIRCIFDTAEPPAMEVCSATSQAAKLLHSTETADSLAVQFQTGHGTFGTIRISTALPGQNTAHVDLFFEKGVIGVVDDLLVVRSTADGRRVRGLRSGTCGWGSEAASLVIADMCNAIRYDKKPSVDGADAVRTLRLCRALFAESSGDSNPEAAVGRVSSTPQHEGAV